MKDSEGSGALQQAGDLDAEQARLAYSIIERLLTHTQVVSDLVAVMATLLDRDTTQAVTNTPHWQAYLESRRALDATRKDIEKLVEIMKKLA